MKLTKAKLEKNLTPLLEKLGYTWFKNTIYPFQGIFVKVVSPNLYLTLGMTISRYYDDSFTGDFYLSKTTRIGSVWGDIPNDSYKRVSFFLSEDELNNYRDEGSCLRDVWWEGLVPDSVDDFILRVRQCEPRICNDIMLKGQIEESVDVRKLQDYSAKTMDIVDNLPMRGNYNFIPPKEIDNIPMKWFMAAEEALCFFDGTVNKNTVKNLALDAFIQYCLSHRN